MATPIGSPSASNSVTPPTAQKGRGGMGYLDQKIQGVAKGVINRKDVDTLLLSLALRFPFTTKEESENLKIFLAEVKKHYIQSLSGIHPLIKEFLLQAVQQDRGDIIRYFLPSLHLYNSDWDFSSPTMASDFLNLYMLLLETAFLRKNTSLMEVLIDDLVMKLHALKNPNQKQELYEAVKKTLNSPLNLFHYSPERQAALLAYFNKIYKETDISP